MTIEYGKLKKVLKKRNTLFINNCLQQLTKEILNGTNNKDEYYVFKTQAADDLEKRNQSLLIKGKLDNQLVGEQASIANILNEKERI